MAEKSLANTFGKLFNSKERFREEDLSFYKTLIDLGIFVVDGDYLRLDDEFQSNFIKILKKPIKLKLTNKTKLEHCNFNYKKLLDMVVIHRNDLYKNDISANNSLVNDNTYNINTFIKDIKLVSNNEITNKGFEFLLLRKDEQMWFLLVKKLTFELENNADGFSEYFMNLLEILEEPTRIDSFIESEIKYDIINFLIDIGIYYDGFVDNSSLYDHSSLSNKFMYLETNYKIYAYTVDRCDREILNLFSECQCELPGLIKSVLDENKVIKALDRGISIEQIVKYINRHCKMTNKNVLNQLYIWNDKRNRIQKYSGYLLDGFKNYNEYKNMLNIIKKTDEFIYNNDEEKVIFVRNVLEHFMQ